MHVTFVQCKSCFCLCVNCLLSFEPLMFIVFVACSDDTVIFCANARFSIRDDANVFPTIFPLFRLLVVCRKFA